MPGRDEDSRTLVHTFQLSRELPRRRAVEMEEGLLTLWHLAFGRAPHTIDADLDALRKQYFDPVAQGKRLRTNLSALRPPPTGTSLPAALAVAVGSDRLLITPEGRLALELLRAGLAAATARAVALDELHARHLEHVLLDAYREWSRHRLEQVVGLLGDEALRPPVIGLLLTMLVNRSVGPSRAIKRYPEGPERDAIDEAFRAPAGAFADIIDPNSHRSLRKERLVSGWTLYEVTRRYPEAVIFDERTRLGRVYVAEGHEKALLDAAARALSRKHTGLATAGRAFDELVASLRDQRQRLSSYEMYFERSSETARLREELLRLLDEKNSERAAL